jgi:hypothetical protein
MAHCLRCWLFLFLICGSATPLFGAFPIEAIIFDQDGSGPLTSTGVITLDAATMSAAELESIRVVGPELAGLGAAVAWVQSGTAIKAIMFNQHGSGPLKTSGVISLGTAAGHVTHFQLSGIFPEEPGEGAVAAWVENGTNIQAVIFDQNGSGPLTTTGIISLGTATTPVTSFQLTGFNPEAHGDGAAVAWVENGTTIKAITFDKHGAGPLTTSGVISLGTAAGNITAFQLTGENPENSTSGAAVAWVEDGTNIKAITFDKNGAGPLTSSGIISLGTAAGPATHFQLSGFTPEHAGDGAVVAWVENRVNIKAILFDKHGAGPLTSTGIISLGTATAPVASFRLDGLNPEFHGMGAVVAWVEETTNMKAIIFDQDGAGPLTSTGIISLGTASERVSSFQLSGGFPEIPGRGAGVAWVENGMAIKAITFDQNGSGPLTKSGIISLGNSTSGPVTFFQISGPNPELSGVGSVVTWVVGAPKSRAFLRPSNRR